MEAPLDLLGKFVPNRLLASFTSKSLKVLPTKHLVRLPSRIKSLSRGVIRQRFHGNMFYKSFKSSMVVSKASRRTGKLINNVGRFRIYK